MKILHFIIAFSILLFSGCNLLEKEQKVVLWTDRPEFIAYGGIFNSIQNDYKLEVIYKASPAESVVKNGKRDSPRVDIFIGPYLNSIKIADNFQPLDRLFDDEGLKQGDFYNDALQKGQVKSRQLLIPVSFNIPVFLFRSGEVKQDISSFTLDKSTFLNICLDFNNTKSTLRKSSFSPLWDKQSPFFFSLLSDGIYVEKADGYVAFDDGQLEENLQFVRGLVTRLHGSFHDEKAFRDKYLYKMPFDLLESGRIFFSYSDVSSFYTISDSRRKNLNFRFFVNTDGKISVCEDMLFAGISKKAVNKKGAMAFLVWFFNTDTQQSLIAQSKAKDIRTFGIAGGFSTLRAVNENTIQKTFPIMVGHIPTEEILNFPASCPPDWKKVKNGAIIPWLFSQSSQEKTNSELVEAIDDLRKLNTGL